MGLPQQFFNSMAPNLNGPQQQLLIQGVRAPQFNFFPANLNGPQYNNI